MMPMLPVHGPKIHPLLQNDPGSVFDGLNTRPTNIPSMIIRPSPKRRRGRYEEVEFDVPGVVRTKRCRVGVTLEFVTKEVADAYGPTL
jgi:hypothetical protein